MLKDKRGNMYLRRNQQPTGRTTPGGFVEWGIAHFHNKIRRFESIECSLMAKKHNLFFFISSLAWSRPLWVPRLYFSIKKVLPSHCKLSFHSFGKYVYILTANQKKSTVITDRNKMWLAHNFLKIKTNAPSLRIPVRPSLNQCYWEIIGLLCTRF